MRKLLLALAIAVTLLSGLLITTAFAQSGSEVEITAVNTATTPVQVGQDVHIGVTYTIVGTQTITTTQPSPYLIDVDVKDTSDVTVASCQDPLDGILGLSNGQDNTYTCSVVLPRAGTFTVAAAILSNPAVVTSTGTVSTTTPITPTVLTQSTSMPSITAEEADSVLPSGVLQLFAGLAIFSAVMLIVAVGTETVVSSIKVALGMKTKVNSLQALTQLQSLLPGKLDGAGVDKESQAEVTKLIKEVKAVVKPTLKLPDLTQAIADGDVNQFVTTLEAMAPDSKAVKSFTKQIQSFIHVASGDVEALQKPLLTLLNSMIGELNKLKSNSAIQDAIKALPIDTVLTDLTDVETKLQAIKIDPNDLSATFQEVYALFAKLIDLVDGFMDKLHDWGDKATADWLRLERNVLLQESKATILENFNVSVMPALESFDFIAPNLATDAQTALQNFLIKLDGVATSQTDLYIRSVDNLLHGVEVGRFNTQSPLRKLWRRLRNAGSIYGVLGVWLLVALALTLLGYLLQPLLVCDASCMAAQDSLVYTLRTNRLVVAAGSGGLAALLVLITAVAGYFIYHLKHNPRGLQAGAATNQTRSATSTPANSQADDALPPQKPARQAKAKAASDKSMPNIQTAVHQVTQAQQARTKAAQAQDAQPPQTPKPAEQPQSTTSDGSPPPPSAATPPQPARSAAPPKEPSMGARIWKRCLPWLNWCFGDPKGPTILSYMEVFWNWVHGKTDLDPIYFDKPPTLNQAIAKSLNNNEVGASVQGIALTAENLAQVVLLRNNQQVDEEKTRKRLMRVLAMFIGTILAYLLQIDAAVLLDSALPGTSGLINALFVIQGSYLHAHWPFLPATLNITPGIILTGLAASAGSAFWHDQLERVQAAKEVTKTAASVLQQAKSTIGDLGDNN